MKLTTRLLTLGTLVLLLGACSSGDLSETDSGGVRLSLDVDGEPQQLKLSTDVADLETITIQSIDLDPSSPNSSLMNVELQSLEFTYTREDTGTRVPPKLVVMRPGSIPVSSSLSIANQAFMLYDQLEAQPLKDLMDFGRDTETNSVVVRMRITIRAFGRTLAGDAVDSAPASFSVEIFR